MRFGLIAIGLLLGLPAAAAAQSFLWAGYGRNADDASGLVTGEHLNLGYALNRSGSGLSAAVGLPVDADTSSRWGALGAWFDAPSRTGWGTVGVRGHATGFLFSDPVLDSGGAGSAAALDGYGEIGRSGARVQLRVGGRHGAHAVESEITQRLLSRLGAGLATGRGPLSARAGLDHWRAEEGGYTQLGAQLGLAHRRFDAWAGLEHWLDEDLDGTGWELGLRVSVSPRLALLARGGAQAADILFWIPSQRVWSLGLQLRTGAEPLPAALPVPVLRDGRRSVTFRLPAEGVEAPAVAGTFSGWERIAMERVGGEWRIDVVLEPGVHEYAFVAADGSWFVPADTPGRKADGFGGHVALLIVQ
jgi:hypothetical protein